MQVRIEDMSSRMLAWATACAIGFTYGEMEGEEGSLVVQLPSGPLRFIRAKRMAPILNHGRWAPESDWQQAGMVVDMLGVSPRRVSESGDEQWAASVICKQNGIEKRFEMRGANATQAICRAAVLAKIGSSVEVPPGVAMALNLQAASRTDGNVINLHDRHPRPGHSASADA